MANKVGFGITELNLIGSSGTPKIDSPNNLNINAVNVAISTNATIGGILDVDGPTELDHVNVSGVSTFNDNVRLLDDDKLQIGSSQDLEIYHSSNQSYIKNKTGNLSFLTLDSGAIGIRIVQEGAVSLYHNNTERLTTTDSGVNISHGLNITGIATAGKQIVGIATNNVIPFLYSNYSDLPSATTYHGAFAHVHGAGKAYFAHAAAWYELVHVDNASHTVGLGTEKYNVGILTATSIKVGTGVTVSSDGDSFVTGISTATKFVGDLSDAVTSRWSVSNSGASAYRFTGPGGLDGTADNSTIYLARGQTYEFNVSASGHPFQIRVSNGGSAYDTGVTNNGAQVGVIKFEVPFAAPNTLVYQCTSHSGMLGNIVIYPSI